MKKLIIFTLFILILSCNNVDQKQNIELMPTQTIFVNDTLKINVQDLFFAKDHSSLKFHSHGNIKVNYNKSSKIITIFCDSSVSNFETIRFDFNNNEYDIPIKIISKQYVKFSFSPPTSSEFVSVFGNFNEWNRHEFQMRDDDNNGSYSIELPFEPGTYEYKFFADDKEYLDPNNSDSIPNGLGGFNSPLIIQPNFKGKKPHITPLKFDRTNNSFIYSYKFLSNDLKNNATLQNFNILFDNKLLPKNKISFKNNIIKIKLNSNEYNIANLHNIRLIFANGNILSNILHTKIIDGIPISLNNSSFTWNDAIIYSLMIDRFCNGDSTNDDKVIHPNLADRANFQGGDLQGIIDKINNGYFNKLGINTLWISPFLQTTDSAFQESPEPHRWFTGYHGYWPINPRKVEKRFGTNKLLKKMIRTAHEHDIKVLMDFISNHVHKEHPYFREHRDWFGKLKLPDGRNNLRLWNEHRLTTWFDPYLPSYDYLHSKEAIDQVVSDAIWWLENYDLDGFRHDAVKHVPNKFWRQLTYKIKSHFPEKEIYQIGETFGDYDLVKSYVNNGQLSAQFNFNLYWPARDSFTRDDGNFKNLNRAIEQSMETYGQLNLMGNIMDSHDQPRLAAYLDKDLKWSENAAEAGWQRNIKIDEPLTYKKIELYFAYLMTIPGIPTMYYGDEIGITGAADPDNRRMMKWNDVPKKHATELKNNIAKLTNLRNSHSALRYGDYISLKANDNTFAYLRNDFSGKMLIVINYCNNGKKIEFKLPKDLQLENKKHLYGNGKIKIQNNNFSIETEPYTVNIFGFENI